MNSPEQIAIETPSDEAGYEVDFVLWSERQAQLLRDRNFHDIDLDNLIEELDAMGRSERRELRSRLTVLLMHLLKCSYQPLRKSASWIGTLGEQRHQIDLLLEQNPSLRNEVPLYMDHSYAVARHRAALETKLPLSSFPDTNPFSMEQIFKLDYLP